ncbi:MAG: hypothetical protein LC676_09405 [Loktanella sp.]|nr:hypothetical protein [Loktanella sp.]
MVTVPTPIAAHKRSDLTPLIKASETIARVLKRGDIVIYECIVPVGINRKVKLVVAKASPSAGLDVASMFLAHPSAARDEKIFDQFDQKAI